MFLGFDQLASPERCLDFDLTIERFDLWQEIRASKRQMVHAEKGDPKNPKTPAPYYQSLDELLGYAPSQYDSDDDEESLSASEAEILDRFETDGVDDIDRLIREARTWPISEAPPDE